MCYGMGCRYERHDGPDAGECTLGRRGYPVDAACMIDWETPESEAKHRLAPAYASGNYPVNVEDGEDE